MPGTHVHTTVAKIYRRSHAGYACNYDCTEIYRRSHAGNACCYDCTDIYREEGREGGRKEGIKKLLQIRSKLDML